MVGDENQNPNISQTQIFGYSDSEISYYYRELEKIPKFTLHGTRPPKGCAYQKSAIYALDDSESPASQFWPPFDDDEIDTMLSGLFKAELPLRVMKGGCKGRGEEVYSMLMHLLTDSHQTLKFSQDTLYRSMYLLSELLTSMSADELRVIMHLRHSHIKRLVITVVTVTGKFEEGFTRSDQDMRVAFRLSSSDFARWERFILRLTKFNLAKPTPSGFFSFFIHPCQGPYLYMYQYFVETYLSSFRTIEVMPSKVTAAAVLLWNILLDTDIRWSISQENRTGYTEKSLIPLAYEMVQILKKDIHKPTHTKFSHDTFRQISVQVTDILKHVS